MVLRARVVAPSILPSWSASLTGSALPRRSSSEHLFKTHLAAPLSCVSSPRAGGPEVLNRGDVGVGIRDEHLFHAMTRVLHAVWRGVTIDPANNSVPCSRSVGPTGRHRAPRQADLPNTQRCRNPSVGSGAQRRPRPRVRHHTWALGP